jgi:hypothetical protein
MADYESFRHGGVTYPLPASTANPLLRDADPALHHALDYLAAALHIYIGARLTAQAALEGLVVAAAVAQKLHTEPAPFLLADKFTFPALAVYRKSETYADRTIAWAGDVAEWEFAYVLPPLTPRQIERLTPILRSATQAIRHAVDQGFHPQYNGGQKVWAAAGIESIRITSVRYGGYEPISEIPNYYRAIVGTMHVAERGMPFEGDFDALDGVDGAVDVLADDETVVPDVAAFDADTKP